MAGLQGMAANAGTLSYQEGVAQDRQVYDDIFAPDTMALRSIGLGLAGSGGNSREAAMQGVSNAGRLFDIGAQSFERDQLRYGRGSADSVDRNKRRLGLSRVIAQVDAGNRASRGAEQNRRDAQAFGSQFYSDSIVGGNNMLSKIAGAETDRETQFRAARQSAESASLALGGTVTGSTLSMI